MTPSYEHDHDNYLPSTPRQCIDLNDADEHDLNSQQGINMNTPCQSFQSPFATSFTPNSPPRLSRECRGEVSFDSFSPDLLLPNFGQPYELMIPQIVSSDEGDLEDEDSVQAQKTSVNLEFRRTTRSWNVRPSSSYVGRRRRRQLAIRILNSIDSDSNSNLNTHTIRDTSTSRDTSNESDTNVTRRRKNFNGSMFARIA
jgi:hypothetical protein